MIRLSVLGSGSSGNAAVVVTGGCRVLVDAGLSAKQLALRLEHVGIDPASLDAIVLTHEHGDHTRGLDVFCRKYAVPVVCTPLTCELLRTQLKAPKEWRLAPTGTPFAIGDVEVLSFSVPHDAVDPVGFVFRCATGTTLGVVSDVGHVTETMAEKLHGLDALFVEANYDALMLENDTKRPWSTKQRISAHHGHLSNDQTADLLATVARPGLHRVFLGHLSDDCNDPAVAREVAEAALERAGVRGVRVRCAGRHEPTPLVDVAAAPPEAATPARPAAALTSPQVQAEFGF